MFTDREMIKYKLVESSLKYCAAIRKNNTELHIQTLENTDSM